MDRHSIVGSHRIHGRPNSQLPAHALSVRYLIAGRSAMRFNCGQWKRKTTILGAVLRFPAPDIVAANVALDHRGADRFGWLLCALISDIGRSVADRLKADINSMLVEPQVVGTNWSVW